MTEELHDWQKSFTLRGALNQGDVERFENALAGQGKRLTGNSGKGAMLCAAIEANWIEAPPCEFEVVEKRGKKTRRYLYDGKNVDELHAGAVQWLGAQVDKTYGEATTLPKNL